MAANARTAFLHTWVITSWNELLHLSLLSPGEKWWRFLFNNTCKFRVGEPVGSGPSWLWAADDLLSLEHNLISPIEHRFHKRNCLSIYYLIESLLNISFLIGIYSTCMHRWHFLIESNLQLGGGKGSNGVAAPELRACLSLKIQIPCRIFIRTEWKWVVT